MSRSVRKQDEREKEEEEEIEMKETNRDIEVETERIEMTEIQSYRRIQMQKVPAVSSQ